MAKVKLGPEEVAAILADYRRRLLGPFVLVLLVARMAVGVTWLGTTLPSRRDLTFPESAVAARALDVAAGGSAYTDWRLWPHAFAPYGPLTYYPVGSVARFAVESERRERVLILGRLQSLASLVGIVVLAAALARRLGARGAWVFVAAAVALSWETLFVFAASYRPDGPAVFFALLAFWIIGRERIGPWRTASALIALGASFWFKATSWGLAAAIFFRLFERLGWRRGGGALGIFVLVNGALFLAGNKSTEGLLQLNLIGSLNNGLRAANYLELAERVPLWAWIVFALGIGASLTRLKRRRSGSAEGFVALGFILSAANAAATYLKVGADINYWLAPFVLASILGVDGVRRTWERGMEARGSKPRDPLALAREAALVGLLIPIVVYVNFDPLARSREDLRANVELWGTTEVAERVRREQGDVLSVIPYLGFVSRGERAVLDHYQYRALGSRGLLETEPLLARVRGSAFSAVFVEMAGDEPAEEYYAPEFGAALLEAYRESERFGTLALMRPRHPRDDAAVAPRRDE